MKRITNKEIAKALDLSTAAVSMALNDKPGVSDQTRLRVYDYINQNQHTNFYTSHPSTSSPVNNPTQNETPNQTLLLCIHKSHGVILVDKPFFSTMIRVIQTEAAKYGFSMVILHSDSNTNLVECRNTIMSLNASGIILVATEMTQQDMPFYQSLNLPMVLLDGYFDFVPTNSVTIDNSNSIMQAYKYAYDHGHRDIGYIKSKIWISNFEHRFDGYLKAQRNLPNTEHNSLVLEVSPSIDGSYRKIMQYLESQKKELNIPTCFLCDLDYIAIGAIRAFKEFGYLIPDDISFIGFDDVESAIVCDPPLTTIHLQQQLLGLEAIHLLLKEIKSTNDSSYMNIHVLNNLVIRDSVQSCVK